MRSKTIIITGCNNCPFCDNGYETFNTTCNAQKDESKTNEIKFEDGVNITPAWCPLKQFKSIVVCYE